MGMNMVAAAKGETAVYKTECPQGTKEQIGFMCFCAPACVRAPGFDFGILTVYSMQSSFSTALEYASMPEFLSVLISFKRLLENILTSQETLFLKGAVSFCASGFSKRLGKT